MPDSQPGQRYAYLSTLLDGVRTIQISVELYDALPVGTALQKVNGMRVSKGHGILKHAPDYRVFEGGHQITDVGFPPSAGDPAPPRIFLAGYRDH